MDLMNAETINLGISTALLLGISSGASLCTFACFPFLSPIFLTSGVGTYHSWRILLPFSLGRISGYSLVGLIAGLGGKLMAGPGLEFRWLLGGATIIAAISLWWRLQQHNPIHATKTTIVKIQSVQPTHSTCSCQQSKFLINLLPGSLFFMGLGMALNPCPALNMIFLTAAITANAVEGILLGMSFGIGAVLIPTLIFAFGIAHLAEEIKLQLIKWRKIIENIGVIMLILLGLMTIGWTTS